MSKKIYVRVDKPIEVGDLVRNLSNEGHEVGEIRKIKELGDRWLRVLGCSYKHLINEWEPVHKLKAGDIVLFRGSGPYKVTEFAWDLEETPVLIENPWDYDDCLQVSEDDLELYPLEKHDPKPTLGVDYGKEQYFSVTIDRASANALRKTLGIPTAQEYYVFKQRRNFMKRQVAEMIVELLDKQANEFDVPKGSVYLATSIDRGITKVLTDPDDTHIATHHPSDTWDTLTGVYVALCKATGRKLPDWIYGEGR